MLDVATFDGFWAFEFERRGAEVVGIDLPTSADLDWPWGARDIVQAEKLEVPMGEGFRLAAEALGSKAERVTCSVYDLPTSGLGPFDLCFIGDVLLHLARPLDALKAVRSVCDGRLILVDRYDPTITGQGDSLLRYHGGWHADAVVGGVAGDARAVGGRRRLPSRRPSTARSRCGQRHRNNPAQPGRAPHPVRGNARRQPAGRQKSG